MEPISLTPVPATPPARWLRSLMVWSVVLFLAAGVAAGTYFNLWPNPFKGKPVAVAQAPKTNTSLPTVKVIRPKQAASVPIIVENIAMVEPYFRADLKARASGIVRQVNRDIGDKVKTGEVLIEIDVPESEQEVARAEAMILQRQQELKVSQAKLKDAKAARDVSSATIKQRQADVEGAVATRDLKKRKYERFKELAEKGSVVGNLVEEEERDYLSSEATLTSAKANVERARADFAESESKVEAASADIELKNAQILVAQKELERAKAVADYGKIVAPFDGVVVRRNVDPGSFVQNATTGSSEALISISKVDLITVASRFSDSVAPHVTANTVATVRFEDLPGLSITAKITRHAPSVQNADRTMRVELDLFNGDAEEFRRLEEAMKPGSLNRPTKGASDSLPVRAFPEGTPTQQLLPGMTGSMTLNLGGFGESFVIPSAAVYSKGGAAYLLILENNKTRHVPVRVQVSDGKTARVVLMANPTDSQGRGRELTGSDLVVTTRQQDFADGVAVTPAIAEW